MKSLALPSTNTTPKIEGDRDRATNAAFEADNRIRFQFVGQQRSAAALDKAEEATMRLDNLGVAREMESQQKDAKAIKLATGWERGGDGKWRYEIMDGELKKEPNVKEKVSSDGEVHYETTLGEILDNEQLYRSYPEVAHAACKHTADGCRRIWHISSKWLHVFEHGAVSPSHPTGRCAS